MDWDLCNQLLRQMAKLSDAIDNRKFTLAEEDRKIAEIQRDCEHCLKQIGETVTSTDDETTHKTLVTIYYKWQCPL